MNGELHYPLQIAPFVTTAADGALVNERVLTGTSNQITVTDNGAGSTVVLSTPQNIHTAATPTFASLTLTSAAGLNLSGTFPTITNGSNGKIAFDTSNRQIHFHPSVETRYLTTLEDAIAAGGTDYTDTRLSIFGRSGLGAVANFFTAQINLGAIDGTSAATAYGIGTDGQWTNGGGFSSSSTQWWLFDTINTLHILRHRQSAPAILEVGDSPSGDGMSLLVFGLDVTTQADNTVLAFDTAPDIIKNDTNTRTFPVVRIKPTLNAGGSNANTTLNLLHIDTTNTSVTGITTNLLKVDYGGTERLSLTSAGNLAVDLTTLFVDAANDRVGVGTITPLGKLTLVSNSDASCYQQEYVGASSAPGLRVYKARGTEAAPRRVLSGDSLMVNNALGAFAADDSTDASFSGAVGRFAFAAAATFTSTEKSTDMFVSLANGNTAIAEILRLKSYGVLKIAGTAARGTTEGTNRIDLFDGTAPVGTLTNGVSLYASSGELLAMDAGGAASNLTLPFTSSVQGIVPASGGTATHKFLTQAATFASPVYCKSVTIETPSAAEDLSLFWTDDAITIIKMVAVLVGSSTPSVTWTVRHGTDRNAAGTEVVTGGTTTTSTTTGSVVTAFNDATIVADAFVWLETTAQSGIVGQIHLSICYTVD